MDSNERTKFIKEIIDFCNENSIISYYELEEYAYKNSKDDWIITLRNKGCRMVIVEYLKSKKRSEKRKYNIPRYEAMRNSIHAATEYHKKKEREYIKELDAMEDGVEDLAK